jgi:D-alanyl-lipoteichoic acid acyltransferase DltB (MBOAT superfamily)
VYIPLGGSQGSTSLKIRNVFIIFIVSGFWHGANWTFIFWGLLNAFYFLPLLLAKKNRANLEIVAAGRYLPGGKELIHMGITFGLTVFAWIFFRAESLGHAFEYVGGILSWSSFALPEGRAFMNSDIHPLIIILLIVIFMAIEWFGREHHFAIAKMQFLPKRALRYGVYTLLILSIIVFGGQEQEFIYFQF